MSVLAHSLSLQCRSRVCVDIVCILLLVSAWSGLNAQGFVDVSVQAGIIATHDGNLHSDTLHIGSGGGWIDANGDALPDIYITKRLSANLLYINNGNGSFTESAASYGIQNTSGDGAGVAVADFNNDGYDDLFLANNNANRLFMNTGGTGFIDVTVSAGFDTTEQSRSTSAAWADYNKDGFVDLYVTNHLPVEGYMNGSTNDKLYKNNGNGTFSDVSNLVGDTGILSGNGATVLWTDFDRDKDIDLIVINDCSAGYTTPNQVYRNDGNTHPTLPWKFTEIGAASGLDLCATSFGASVGDYNSDGWMDVFISGQGECYLMQNMSGAGYSDVTASALITGISPATQGWSTAFIDIDLDGWQDLIMAQGSWNSTSELDPQANLVFLNNGDGTFANISAAQSMDDVSKTRNILYGDYDADGDPDMLIIGYGEPVILKKNENHNDNNYINVKLLGVQSNRNCIGARLKLTMPDSTKHYLEVSGREGFGGTNMLSSFFGIGTQTKAASLQVIWPVGLVQTIHNIPIGRVIELVEPSGIQPLSVAFTNVAIASGIDATCGFCNPGGGVSFADFNDDGWDDLTFCTVAGDSVLFYVNNQDGTFTHIPSLVSNTAFQRSATWVDYDNDGDKDLYLSNISDLNETPGTGSKNRLYQNDGNLVLTDVTLAAGLPNIEDPSYSAHFGDVNNDGWLDIYVNNWNLLNPLHTNYLYVSDGDGTFTNMTSTYQCSNSPTGTPPGYPGLAAAFLDINENGLQDIFIANDRYFFPNVLYKNITGTYADISVSSGTNDTINGMNVGVGDYDNDGDMDLYITNTGDTINPLDPHGGNLMLRNNGDETFTDVATDLGVQFYKFGWGANFLDCDLDMDLDLYVCAQNVGHLYGNDLYLNDLANDTFVVASIPGMMGDTIQSFSNAIGDFNNDGLPDIAVNNATPLPPYPVGTDVKFHLWRNDTQTSGRWLKIKLRGTVSNRDGIGSWISYYIDGQRYVRYTYCGEAYLAQNSSYVFFGSGSNYMVDSIVVKWLSGNESRLYNVVCNQTLLIDESTVIYVAHDAPGMSTGMSWVNAFTDLQDALDYARVNTGISQIWVKTGTYYPDATDRYASFEMPQGVQLYGGFNGTETTLAQRNPALYPVTLSGDIGIPASEVDNSFHVVSIAADVTSFLLDGVLIQSGNANGAATTQKYGGGVYSLGTGTLKDVQISDCNAEMLGSAIYHSGASKILNLQNITLSANIAPATAVSNSTGGEIRWMGMNQVQN